MSESSSGGEFKKVEIPPKEIEIPGEWGIEKIGDIGKLNPSNVDKKSRDSEEPVKLCNYIDVYENEYITHDIDFMEATASEKEINRFRLKQGDVMFTKDSEDKFDIAVPAVVQESLENVLCGYHLFLLKPDSEIINSVFLLKMLESYPVRSQFSSKAQGTTRFGLNVPATKNSNIPVPPIEEQRKLASVLYTVDQAIQQTEEIIEQTKRVESALFQDLFSGIHLDCETKEDPTFGEIPKHWVVRPMGEICDITMGTSPKSEYYNETGDGLPFFQANNEFGMRTPTHDRWCSNPVKTANEDDILMTIRGTYVGQVNISDRECCIGRGLAGISAVEDHIPEFLYHHLRERENYVKSIAIGSTFDSVSSEELENLSIVIPPIPEQEQIANTLYTIQKQMIEAEAYSDQLNRLKHGLMQDLLSGEIRTHDKDIEIVDEVLAHG